MDFIYSIKDTLEAMRKDLKEHTTSDKWHLIDDWIDARLRAFLGHYDLLMIDLFINGRKQ